MSKPKFSVSGKTELSSLVRHLILGWLLSVAIEYFDLPIELRDLSGLEGMAQMSLSRVIIGLVCISSALFLLSCFVDIAKQERWGIVAAAALILAGSLGISINRSYLAVCAVLMTALVIFGSFGWREHGGIKSENRIYLGVTVWLSAAFFLFVSAWGVGRVRSFSVPNYDFGIFSQMFYNMKECGLPLTTVERDGLLSHFAVHVSPIYYLMLPAYWLFPKPETLQVLQALVLASAVIPLWKLGKHHGLPEAQRMLVCILLLLYPAFSGGTSYDLHENCFLTALILWVLYGLDIGNTILTVAAALLTLLVKEDAAVYVAVIGLWFVLKTLLHPEGDRNKNLLIGIELLLGAICWFYLVTYYLNTKGDGVMTYRYNNFMYDGSSSLVTVIKSVILNPMKLIYECADPGKVKYMLLTLLPLLALPLLTRRYERYIQLIPYVLVNLMSDYSYQHDVFYQYNFGSTAFFFYLTVVNLAEFKTDWKRIATLAAAVAVSAVCFYKVILPVGIRYPILTVQWREVYQDIRDTLDTVPEDASVSATTYFITPLSQRSVLYDIRYCEKEHILETEYVVMKIGVESEYSNFDTGDMRNGFENLLTYLEENGYRQHAYLEDEVVIYRRESGG